MKKTLSILNPLICKPYTDLTLEELSALYKSNPTEQILATAYSKVLNLAILIRKRYYTVDEDDAASFCLEKLDYALQNYNSDTSFNFTTFFCHLFETSLKLEIQKNSRKKRKGLLESIEDGIDVGLEDTYNVIEMLLPKNLTTNEHEYCILASEGYDNSDIAKYLGVSRMTICNIRKSLKIKLCGLQI